jgi:hypothetical protein
VVIVDDPGPVVERDRYPGVARLDRDGVPVYRSPALQQRLIGALKIVKAAGWLSTPGPLCHST